MFAPTESGNSVRPGLKNRIKMGMGNLVTICDRCPVENSCTVEHQGMGYVWLVYFSAMALAFWFAMKLMYDGNKAPLEIPLWTSSTEKDVKAAMFHFYSRKTVHVSVCVLSW